ncbi:MAG: hypothetical protein AAF902_24125 [Chloroflexota bacterium]
MGIRVSVQVPDGTFISITDNTFQSKAIFNFLSPVILSCLDIESDDEKVSEGVNWIAELRSQMSEDICLLQKALWGYWEYSKNDYDQYLLDYESMVGGLPKMTYERFLEECKAEEASWIDTLSLKNTVDDLVKVLENIDDEESWFYYPEATIKDFKDLSLALEIALKGNQSKARLWTS